MLRIQAKESVAWFSSDASFKAGHAACSKIFTLADNKANPHCPVILASFAARCMACSQAARPPSALAPTSRARRALVRRKISKCQLPERACDQGFCGSSSNVSSISLRPLAAQPFRNPVNKLLLRARYPITAIKAKRGRTALGRKAKACFAACSARTRSLADSGLLAKENRDNRASALIMNALKSAPVSTSAMLSS